MASLWEFENETQSFTADAVISGLTVNNEQPCSVATLAVMFNDPDAALVFEGHDIITVRFNSVRIFRGRVLAFDEVTQDDHAGPRQWRLTARDFTPYLKRDVITTNFTGSESAADRVARIMTYSSQGFTTTGVAAISYEVGPLDSDGMSVFEALAKTASEVGGSFYVDFDEDLQFFITPTGGSAPFAIRSSDSPSYNPATDPANYGVGITRDFGDQANAYYVVGEGIKLWVEDATSISTYGRIEAPLIDPSIKSTVTAQNVGDSALTKTSEPSVVGRATVHAPGLLPLQTVRLDRRTKWSTNSDFLITGTQITFVSLTSMRCQVQLADRFTPCYVRSPSIKDISRDNTPTDCTDCTRRVAILPSGLDQNISLAPGRGGCFVWDGSTHLARYNCDLVKTGQASPSSSALKAIYHEPVYEAMLRGDRASYTGTVGPFGDDRWVIAVTILAGNVMDVRKAWVVAAGVTFDDFNRTEAGPDIGVTSGTGQTWDRFNHHVSGASDTITTEVNGTRFHYNRTATAAGMDDRVFRIAEDGFWSGPGYLFDQTWKIEIASHQQGVNIFRIFVGDISGSANGGLYDDNGSYVTLRVGDPPYSSDPSEAAAWKLNVGNTIAADVDETLSFDPRGAGPLYLRWAHDGTDWKAKLWKVTDPEPDWGDPDTVTRPHDTDDDLITGNLFAFVITQKAFVAGDRFEMYVDEIDPASGYVLQSRDMTDGSLIASHGLTGQSNDIRRTPDGQHLFVLLGDNDNGPLQRYSRGLAVEESSLPIENIYIDLADWNVDDSYNIYKLTTDGVLTRYNADGELVWRKDLQALYSYRWPSRQNFNPAYGTGQTVIIEDGVVRVAGYIGGATWTSGGSTGVVLTLNRADGSLNGQKKFETTGGNAASQAMALCMVGTCLWVAGAADGGDFEGEAISGLAGWIAKVPPGGGSAGTEASPAEKVTAFVLYG